MTDFRRVFALAAVVASLCPTMGLGDEAVAQRKFNGSAAGDWNCRLGAAAIGTLSVRVNSYVLNRFGTAMAGEYQQADEHVTVTNGPLRGWGADTGTLFADAGPRMLEFPTAGGAVLSCREVL